MTADTDEDHRDRAHFAAPVEEKMRAEFLQVAMLLGLPIASCREAPLAAFEGDSSATAVVSDQLAAINSMVPRELTSVLQFESTTVEGRAHEWNATAPVPKGWVFEQAFPGWRTPPGASNLGFMTKMELGSDCQGACAPKDWKTIIDKNMLSFLADPIVKDELLPNNGRIRIKSGRDLDIVYAAWYQDGAKWFYYCDAWVDHNKLPGSIDAFAAACRSAQFREGPATQ